MSENAEVPNAEIDEAAALAAIDRCEKMQWRQDRSRLGSQVALISEYLHRSAVVAEVLNKILNWPWDDYAAYLPLPALSARFLPGYYFLEKPAYVGPGIEFLEAKIIALTSHLRINRYHASWYGEHACWWYIRWASVKSLPSVAALGLPDPYTPLIMFYERGGWLRQEQGYLDLNGANVTHSQSSLRRRVEQAPLPTLDPAALDRLDTLEPYAWTKKEEGTRRRRDTL